MNLFERNHAIRLHVEFVNGERAVFIDEPVERPIPSAPEQIQAEERRQSKADPLTSPFKNQGEPNETKGRPVRMGRGMKWSLTSSRQGALERVGRGPLHSQVVRRCPAVCGGCGLGKNEGQEKVDAHRGPRVCGGEYSGPGRR